jgi:hypothetical protein
MKIPFVKKPKLTIEQQVAKNVAEFGLPEARGGYEFLAKGYKGRAFAGLFRGIGERGLSILSKPPYAPPTTFIGLTGRAQTAGDEERKRRRGRGRPSTMYAPGFLSPARTRRWGLKATLG